MIDMWTTYGSSLGLMFLGGANPFLDLLFEAINDRAYSVSYNVLTDIYGVPKDPHRLQAKKVDAAMAQRIQHSFIATGMSTYGVRTAMSIWDSYNLGWDDMVSWDWDNWMFY
jgi:hypothetical protein